MEYTHRSRPTDASELSAELIRNAAFVAHESRKAKALEKWLEEDRATRRVLYLYDTDVVVSHCAPWLNGPLHQDKLGRGYGQVLPLQPITAYPPEDRLGRMAIERQRAEAVCWLLSDKALECAKLQQMPILQAKSHYDETFRIYSAVKANAASEAAVTRNSAQGRRDDFLTHMLRFVSKAVADERWDLDGNPGRFLSVILTRMQSRLIQQTSRFVREWDNFISIFRDRGGIFDPLCVSLSDLLHSPKHQNAWTQVRALFVSDADAILSRRQEFREIFEKVIAPERYQLSRHRLMDDVSALETLATANALLAECIPDTIRIVMITGDRKATLALATSPEIIPGPTGVSVADFAFKHVHHLWSFVDSLTPNATSTPSNSRRPELFSGLLAFEAGVGQDEPSASQLAHWSVMGDPQLARHIQVDDIDQSYARWSEYSEGAANLHRHFLVDEAKLKQVSDILIRKFGPEGTPLQAEKIAEMAIETMARARDRTNVQFSEIGANSILEAHRHGIRNPPDLMFDSLKAADGIFRDLALPQRVFMNAGDFARRFDKIADDCYRPDENNLADDDYRQECYIKYLVLGALFASANRWIVAEQHAESALDIVLRAVSLSDRIKTKLDGVSQSANISGREARFLLAVARRIRADSMQGYAKAEMALDEAVESLRVDHAAGTASGVRFVRFECEYLAISLARYYHARSSNDASSCDNEAAAVFSRSLIVLDRLELAQDAGIVGKLEPLAVSTRTSIATNLIQTATIGTSAK